MDDNKATSRGMPTLFELHGSEDSDPRTLRFGVPPRIGRWSGDLKWRPLWRMRIALLLLDACLELNLVWARGGIRVLYMQNRQHMVWYGFWFGFVSCAAARLGWKHQSVVWLLQRQSRQSVLGIVREIILFPALFGFGCSSIWW